MQIVLHTNQMDVFNGGARFNEMTALALHKNGFEVEIYTNGYSDNFVSNEFAKKIKVTDSGKKIRKGAYLPRLQAIFFQIWAVIAYLIYGPRGDVYFSDCIYSLFMVRLFTQQKCYLYVHYPDSLYSRECVEANSRQSRSIRNFYNILCDFFELLSVLSAHRVFCNSNYSKKHFKSNLWYFKRIDLMVLYPFVHNSSQPFELNKWNRSKTSFTFLTINRYDPFKKLDVLIKSFHEVCSSPATEHLDLKLIICGGKVCQEYIWYFESLKKMAKDLEIEQKVVFLSSISHDEKLNLLNSSQAFIYSAFKEHFGIGICEAMECSLPTIAVALGGPLEIIDHAQNGLLAQPSSASMSDCMLDLITDYGLYSKIEKACFESTEKKFHHSKFVQAIVN